MITREEAQAKFREYYDAQGPHDEVYTDGSKINERVGAAAVVNRHFQNGAGGVTVCLAAFAETQLRCRKRSCAQLVQLRAANAASAARAPIRNTIGSMGPQKPNEQYIERR